MINDLSRELTKAERMLFSYYLDGDWIKKDIIDINFEDFQPIAKKILIILDWKNIDTVSVRELIEIEKVFWNFSDYKVKILEILEKKLILL